jgi:hypothetical protein
MNCTAIDDDDEEVGEGEEEGRVGGEDKEL